MYACSSSASSQTKVWNEAEKRERGACEARELRARKTLRPRFTDFFTDFEIKIFLSIATCFR